MYDAVILGGGPAGLSIGSELSKKHKILLIEKGRIGETNKRWTTEYKLLKKTGLEKFISAKFKKSFIKSYNHKFYYYNTGATVDERKVLLHFKSILKNNKCKIHENCTFIDYKLGKENIVVSTTKGNFEARLIIDCSGLNSKIAKKHRLFSNIYFFPIYGEIFNCSLDKNEVNLGEVILTKSPLVWFEVFPISRTRCIAYTFQYTKKNIDISLLKKYHALQLRESEMAKKFNGLKPIGKAFGTIPMGKPKVQSLDRVFLFGDTLLLAAPILGSGFTNILQHYKKFALHLSKKLNQDILSAKELAYNYSKKEQMNRDFQMIIATIFANVGPNELDDFIAILKDLPNKTLSDLIFLRLSVREILIIFKKIMNVKILKDIIKDIPKKEYPIFLEETLKFAEDFVRMEFLETR